MVVACGANGPAAMPRRQRPAPGQQIGCGDSQELGERRGPRHGEDSSEDARKDQNPLPRGSLQSTTIDVLCSRTARHAVWLSHHRHRVVPGYLLAALLHVSPHELLGVLLEDGVDLVEQVVDFLVQLLVSFGCLGVHLGRRRLVDLLVPAGPCPDCDWPPVSRVAMSCLLRAVDATVPGADANVPPPIDADHPAVIASSRSLALGHRSNSAPTCCRVPRSGSIIGTRTSDSRPTSKMTESQLAATTSAAYCRQAPAPEVGPGVLRRLGHRRA